MQRIIGALVTTLAVVALPQFAAAQDGNRPDGPNPERLFNRLDANHDGVITKDEIPANLPERLKNLLREADKNHNGKITKREFMAAFHARHPGPEGPGQHPGHPGPQAGHQAGHFGPPANVEYPSLGGPAFRPGVPGGPMANPGPRPNMPGPHPEGHVPVNANGTGTLVVNGNLIINGGTVIINGGTLVVGRPAGTVKGAAPLGRPMAKPMGRGAALPMLNARAIFDRLDTNHDGKLSFEEFAVGVRHLQQFLATRMGELKKPVWDRIRSFHQKMGQFQGQFGHPGRGPMGQHPGMGPIGGHAGMGPMGGHPGMGPMGMGPMGGHPGMAMMGMAGGFGGHQGGEGKVLVRVFTSSDGDKHGVKKAAAICKCGATKPEECKCGAKKQVACSKCGAKTPEACTCGKKHEAKKPEAKKCETEKSAAGHRSIEARLTALETQQAEILKLLQSITKRDHHGRGGK